MIVLDEFDQGTPEWFAARQGIPTASRMSEIITPKTGCLSATSFKYMCELIAEMNGAGDEQKEPTEWMLRGIELEAEARTLFELEQGRRVRQVGLCKRDDGLASCSPDGLLESAGLEIKCPKASTHVAYLLSGELPMSYRPQVHASMAITGMDEWWFMSYHPNFDPLYLLVKRDGYTSQVESALNEFIKRLKIAAQKIGIAA